MLEVDKKLFIFKSKKVFFADAPFDIKGCHELRFIYCKNKVDANGFECKKELTLITDLTQDLDTIWMGMNRNSQRNIKRAETLGIKISIRKDFNQFYKIYLSLFRKKGILPFLRMFGFGIIPLDVMEKYGTLFVAEYDGEILEGTVYLENKHDVYSWAGASKRFEVDSKKAGLIACASRLCIWEAMKHYKENNKIVYDHGGMWPQEEAENDARKEGINRYKLSFGGDIVTRYSYSKVYSNMYNFMQKLYSLRNL